MRRDNSVSGVKNEWNFNGTKVLAMNGTTYTVSPDLDQRARQNNFLSSLELAINGPSRLQQRIAGFDYTLHRTNIDAIHQPTRQSPLGDEDFQFHNVNNYNPPGFDYQA